MGRQPKRTQRTDRDRTGESLTDDELDRAALMYFVENKSWGVICRTLKTSHNTLQAARETERWELIAKGYQVRLEDLRRTAYLQLERKVKQGNMSAITQALDRTEGAVEQKLKIAGVVDVEHDLSDKLTTPERLASVAGILGNLGLLAAGGPGGAATGADSQADEVHPAPAAP